MAWASPEDEVIRTPRNLLQQGLTTTEDDGTPAAAVILDEANPRLFISLQSPLKITFAGSLPFLDLNS